MRGRLAGYVAGIITLLTVGTALGQPFTICLDAGHGGSDPGAVGCDLEEADVNLKVAKALQLLMVADPDLDPIMTRETDVFVGLTARAEFANDAGADRFVSIHANASLNHDASGIETFCYVDGNIASFDQRNRIQKRMTTLWSDLPDRGGKTASFTVLAESWMPATLSELAFVDHCATDAVYLASQSQLNSAASAHHYAIRESLGLESGGEGGIGSLLGVVYEDQGVGTEDMSVRLPGAKVKVVNVAGVSMTTNVDGVDASWSFSLAAGAYDVTATFVGYKASSRECVVVADQKVWCSIGLVVDDGSGDEGWLAGTIYVDPGDGSGDMSETVSGATVKGAGPEGATFDVKAGEPDADWSVRVATGTWTVTASADGYESNSRTCEVLSGKTAWCSVGLPDPDLPNDDTGKLFGVVYEDHGQGSLDLKTKVIGATVTVTNDDGESHEIVAGAPEAAWQFDLTPGEWNVLAQAAGYEDGETTCTVEKDVETWCPVGLIALEELEDISNVVDVGGPGCDDDSGCVDDVEPDVEVAEYTDENDVIGELGDHSGGWGEDGYILLDHQGVVDGTAAASEGCSGSPSGSAGPWAVILLLVPILAIRLRRKIAFTALFLVAGCPGLDGDGISETPVTTVGSAISAGGTSRVVAVAPLTPARGFMRPVWSPDGGRLAVSGPRGEELYSVDVASGSADLLVKGRAVGHAPRWIDGGRAVAYTIPGQRRHEVPVMSVTLDGRKGSIPERNQELIKVRVRNDQVLLSDRGREIVISPDGDRYCCVVESPDGRRIAFMGLTSGIYVHDMRTGETRHVGLGTSPSFAVDGGRLVYEHCADDGETITVCSIMLVDLDTGGDPVVLSGLPSMARYPALAPDLSTIAFTVEGAIWTGKLVF